MRVNQRSAKVVCRSARISGKHAELSTTEIYTHVAIRKLEQIHAATHPGAKLEGMKPTDPNGDNRQGDEEQKAALLVALEAESDEEE
jgi:integrase/recombinase XerD